jgi:hypothetical protein
MSAPISDPLDSKEDMSNDSMASAIKGFFFRPSSAHTLATIRIFTGAMVAYIHLVWMLNLDSFMGPHALINNATWRALHQGAVSDYKWTYLAHTDSMPLIWGHEILACLSGVLMCLGLCTRTFGFLAWFATLMTAHRMTGMLFGLDQITLMLAMYLCIARSGDVWSMDRWLSNRFQSLHWSRGWIGTMTGLLPTDLSGQACEAIVPDCWSNTFATRLIQLHLCVIYLFGGFGKLRGEMWWDGSAMWYSFAAYEYQSVDMTWTGHFAILSSIATHLTLFWEVGYSALVWPKWTRPWTLAVAVVVHSGIGLFLGMFTFGLMMIVANIAFVSSSEMRRVVGAFSRG